jgi:hypothetical protein
MPRAYRSQMSASAGDMIGLTTSFAPNRATCVADLEQATPRKNGAKLSQHPCVGPFLHSEVEL